MAAAGTQTGPILYPLLYRNVPGPGELAHIGVWYAICYFFVIRPLIVTRPNN
jgi:hypothetical protein